ncbi:MAG: class I SAM-dependent methyltransferase [Bacteroidales bacterium]|nr:class I SAM-dependent methyltransferase [Bacteroidales bacterium]
MLKFVTKLFLKIAGVLSSLPYVFHFILSKDIGSFYQIGIIKKIKILNVFRKNKKRLDALSSWLEHIEMAKTLLAISPSVKGDVIECGCYRGGSTVNLSLICSMVNRKLIVCDSFQGLPEPEANDAAHHNILSDHVDQYYEGRFSASLEEVKNNITKYGSIDLCEFVVGYFEDTLPKLNRQTVMAFLDVDLVQSLKPCILGIWPNLQQGCKVFVHEAQSLTLAALFFDTEWWKKNLHTQPPGFVGAGTGLPLKSMTGSELGFALKILQEK